MKLLLSLLFGCHHKHTSRVFSYTDDEGKHHYVCCLDCGREIAYDWDAMREVA